MKRKWIIAAVGAALLSVGAWAQWGPGMGGYGAGPGMMGGNGYGCGPAGDSEGYGPGARGGGGAYGYGPGTMGGRGGGWGGGPGMTGGRGGGWGGGPGMMGGYGWGYQSLDLSDAQRQKISDIGKELREKQWVLMQTMHGLMWQSEKPGTQSDAEILKNFDAATAVRREMLAARLDARKRIDEVLTKEQHEQLKKYRGW
ncbi:MAG TPA: Spy/CpxP family protein refolding chaperone [Usitatibacter sp.]|nr:Spy/CpxP family protein refolding chaperone [Usitatibacter sp.]